MKKVLLLVVLLFSNVLAFCAPKAAGEIIQVEANPKAGFHWGYALYIPQNLDTSKPLPILFVMNDNGMYKTQEENIKSVMERFERPSGAWVEYGIADGVGVPMVMPMVLRERLTDEPQFLNSHDLNRAVFVLKDGPYARLDLQVLSMLKDARKQLKKRDIRTQKKFLVAGFSSAGSFGDKLTFLHPEKIIALASGGEHYPLLPFETYNGVNLIWPIGAYDMKTYTGRKFNKRAWLKVPIFITEGGDDYNDPLPYDDVYGEEDRAATLQVLGEGNSLDHWERSRQILAQAAPNVQTHTYPHLEHDWVKQDVIDFLNIHKSGGPLKPITPTDTSDRPSVLPIHVTKLYWGYQAKEVLSPELHQYVGENEVNMRVEGKSKFPFWARYIDSCGFAVLYKGEVILENVRCGGQFNDTEKNNFKLQTVRFSDEDVKTLKKTGGKTFSLRSRFPKVWDVPEDLTFTIK